jgi:hypothetical protein
MPGTHDVRLEQYKNLSEEIASLVKETRALELYVAGFTYSGWVLSHCTSSPVLIWIPPILGVCFGAWRSLGNFERMKDISNFLQTEYPEAHWEAKIADIRRERRFFSFNSLRAGSSEGLWAGLLVLSVVALGLGIFSESWRQQGCGPAQSARVGSAPAAEK